MEYKAITQIGEWTNIDIETILEQLPEIYDAPSELELMVGPGVEAVCFRKDGKLHREDGPAVIFSSGSQFWYKNGLRHRDNGPAIICSDGEIRWYKNSKKHREDGPAVIRADGTEEYWLNGEQVDELHTN